MKLNYIGHNQWHGERFPEFYQNVISNDYDKIILFCQNEWEWHAHDPVYWPKLQEYCKSIGKPIHVITAAHSTFYPVQLDNTIINWWDTYLIGKTYCELIRGKEALAIRPFTTPEYKYHFISMNNRPHDHRCLLMDLLVKNNLLDYGAVSFHKNSPIYKWRYFDFKPMILEKEFIDDMNQYRTPKQYYESFVQLISESSNKVIILSEKTATPLILGKVFLVAGQQGFHKFLKGLGFQLFEEIFDYSFDDEPNEEIRYEKLLNNLKRLSAVPVDQLPALHNKIAHKLDYNMKKAKSISFDLGLYPKIALEVIDYYNKTKIEIDHWLIHIHNSLQESKEYSFKFYKE